MTASVRPLAPAASSGLRTAFLLASAVLLFGGAPLSAQTPAFVNWPSSITNVWQSTQVTYTNATYPNGLAVTNVAGPATVTILSSTNGFSAPSSPGQQTIGGTQFVLLYFTPGTNSSVAEPYTNSLQVTLSNAPAGTSASTNISIVITPPPPNNPVFTGSFSNQWQTGPSTNPVAYTNLIGCRVASSPSNSPTQFPVPDITNGTQVFVRFLSNSLGQTGNLTSLPLNASNNYFATSNGFGIVGPYTNVPSGLKPSNPWVSAANLETVASAPGWYDGTNAWVALNIVPGTNTVPVTNYVQLLAYNGANGSTLNWTTNDLAILVQPVLTPPPALEIRFYNSSTNAASNVYIVPSSTDALGSYGNGFWWTNLGGSNNYTNWVNTNGYLSLRLSDLGAPSGTNELGRPYYSVFTTNFPNAAWFISYGGGLITPAEWATNKPAAKTGALWYGYEWGPFEVTLDGNPADKSDMTYINEFSIPVSVRALTNDFTNSLAANYPTNSSANLYQVCGFTNWANSNAVAASLSNLATQLSANFPNARITNSSGKTVMYAGPSAAPAGTLVAPQLPPYTNGVTSNSFPPLTAYFEAVRTASARTNKIKDGIGLAGATNTALGWGNTGTNPVYTFYYDFDLVVTASNTLLLTNGTITVSNQPGSTATNLSPTNYTGLWMEIGADAGVNDNWASAAVYGAPTAANYVTNTGASAAVQLYSTNASNGLSGQRVFNSSTNLWALIATNTATATDTSGAVIPNPSVPQLYQSSFGAKVMGRILGDMAAGFALGFINSDAINPATSQAYGDSPSGSWWGGNEYPAANTVSSNAYSDVNTNYSVWGDAIYSYATKVTYGHPIYDRMQYYGGGNPTSPLQIQPASATNNTGPTGQLLPVWVIEIEFFNGLSSVGAGPVPTPPDAPTITGIAPGDSYLSVAFTPPLSSGSSAITNYEYSTNGGSSWIPFSPASTNSPLFVTNLVNGTPYSLELRAVNGAGGGTASASINGTPDAWNTSFFTVRAPGGVTLLSATNNTSGVSLPASTSTWSSLSDEAAKTGFAEVDHRETLRKLRAVSVPTWRYNHDPVRRYMGPTAQDFRSAFGLGRDDKHIATLDIDGVSLSALKGLIEELRARRESNAAQEKRLAELEAEFERLLRENPPASR